MSTTLTNGLKLPDKGSVDWYADMQNNYAILDGAVGTVAEHSTQIAGKAPAVHTHTKSDITDFPAYGNAAGTICEGNDSRLSDARTPVAHTHTKSDVTDLLNSNFIPSVNNSYDLGSSSYQWNNLYAKNYYYNGTAWGLDKENTWTGANSFYKSIQIHGGRNAYIMPEFGASYSGLAFGTVEFKQSFKFGDWVDNNSTIGINTSNAYVEIYAGLDSSDSVNKARLNPVNTTVAELGTSNNPWKTLNGVNPGALSFPKVDGWNAGQDIDAAGIDTTNWDMTSGTWNELTNNVHDGWIYFAFQNCSPGDRISVRYHGTDARYITLSFAPLSTTGYMYCAFPLAKGFKANIAFTTSGTVMSKFIYPCIGNV